MNTFLITRRPLEEIAGEQASFFVGMNIEQAEALKAKLESFVVEQNEEKEENSSLNNTISDLKSKREEIVDENWELSREIRLAKRFIEAVLIRGLSPAITDGLRPENISECMKGVLDGSHDFSSIESLQWKY